MWNLLEERVRDAIASLPEDRRRRVVTALTWVLNIRRIRWWVWAVAIVPPAAVTFHGQWTYSGVQRWLGDWELARYGTYYETLTGLFVATVLTSLWSLPIVLVALARLARQPAQSAPAAGATASASDDTGDDIDDEDEARIDRRVAVIMAVIVGAIPLVWGGVLWIKAARGGGTLTEIDAGELERGVAPSASYVRVHGKPLHDHAIVTRRRGTNEWELTSYLPIVSAEWKPGAPIAAVVVAPSWKLDVAGMMGEFDARGTIKDGGLGPAGTMFEQSGVKLAPGVAIIELGKTPVNHMRAGQVLAALSVPLALLVWFIARRQGR
jgi:hypothetical protein